MLGKKFNNNFGANLQAYALQHVILSKGTYCEIIDYAPQIGLLGFFSRNLRYKGIKYMISKLVSTQLEEIRKKFIINEREVKRSLLKVNNFKSTHLRFTSKTFRDINELSGHTNYDTYIVGSDLVWDPLVNDHETLPVYLLGFVKEGCKASYAASVGEWIPNWAHPIFRDYLKDFDFISTRDKPSAKSLRKFCTTEIKVVLDPVALLSKEEWIKISRPPETEPKEPYVLVYDIRRFADIQPEIKIVAKKMNWNLVTYIPSKYSFSFYSFDPLEFLWLYKNAEFIVSSSFHGTVFAVLFNKPFYAISPGSYVFPYRIKDFLERMHLEDRFVENPKELRVLGFDKPDWHRANKCLEDERRRSFGFLRKVLEGDKK